MPSEPSPNSAPEQPAQAQPWWLPNPALRRQSGLGLFGGWLVVILLLWPPLALAALIIYPDDHAALGLRFDPETLALRMRNPVGTLAIVAFAGALSVHAGWLLWRGRRRRHLWRIVICLWLILPGQSIALALLHWYMLWRDNIVIYDVPLRIGVILNMALPAAIISAYLLLSPRMQRRFTVAAENVADVF